MSLTSPSTPDDEVRTSGSPAYSGSFVLKCSSRPGVDADNRYRQDVPASNRYEGHEDRVRQHAQRIGHMLKK